MVLPLVALLLLMNAFDYGFLASWCLLVPLAVPAEPLHTDQVLMSVLTG
jgi:hypothetical protein